MVLEVVPVRTVILGPRPPEVEALIERRRALGLDRRDEIWEGEYHMAPYAHGRHGWLDQAMAEVLGPLCRARGLIGSGPVNLGVKNDFRVPDRVIHRDRRTHLYYPTVAMVVEILSPDDETFEKFGFYAAHGVDEILVVDAATRTVRLWVLDAGQYQESDDSGLLGVPVSRIAEQIAWPPPSDDADEDHDAEGAPPA